MPQLHVVGGAGESEMCMCSGERKLCVVCMCVLGTVNHNGGLANAPKPFVSPVPFISLPPSLPPWCPPRRAAWPNGEWGYSTRRHMLEPVRAEAVLPDRALYLPTFSRFLIVKKTCLSLSFSRFLFLLLVVGLICPFPSCLPRHWSRD